MRIEIHQQYTSPLFGAQPAEGHGSGGFTNSAFLIGYCPNKQYNALNYLDSCSATIQSWGHSDLWITDDHAPVGSVNSMTALSVFIAIKQGSCLSLSPADQFRSRSGSLVKSNPPPSSSTGVISPTGANLSMSSWPCCCGESSAPAPSGSASLNN